MLKITEVKPVVSVLEGGTGAKNKTFNNNKNNSTLPVLLVNQSEYTLLKQAIKVYDEAIKETTKEMQSLYDVLWCSCDKDKPETLESFKQLNKVKQQLKATKKLRQKFASLNKKLKLQVKH